LDIVLMTASFGFWVGVIGSRVRVIGLGS